MLLKYYTLLYFKCVVVFVLVPLQIQTLVWPAESGEIRKKGVEVSKAL